MWRKRLFVLVVVLFFVAAAIVIVEVFYTTPPFRPSSSWFDSTSSPAETQSLTDIARSYLQSDKKVIHLNSFVGGNPVSPTDAKVAAYNIDWNWFVNHDAYHVADISSAPQMPDSPPVPAKGYRTERYLVYWIYPTCVIIVSIDSNHVPQYVDISPPGSLAH